MSASSPRDSAFSSTGLSRFISLSMIHALPLRCFLSGEPNVGSPSSNSLYARAESRGVAGSAQLGDVRTMKAKGATAGGEARPRAPSASPGRPGSPAAACCHANALPLGEAAMRIETFLWTHRLRGSGPCARRARFRTRVVLLSPQEH